MSDFQTRAEHDEWQDAKTPQGIYMKEMHDAEMARRAKEAMRLLDLKNSNQSDDDMFSFLVQSKYMEKGKVFCHPDDAQTVNEAFEIYSLIQGLDAQQKEMLYIMFGIGEQDVH